MFKLVASIHYCLYGQLIISMAVYVSGGTTSRFVANDFINLIIINKIIYLSSMITANNNSNISDHNLKRL